MAAVATSSVLTVDQLMRAMEASHEGKKDHVKKHLGYAAIGAAVAIGAMELLRRDNRAENEEEEDERYDDDAVVVVDTHRHGNHGHHHHHEDEEEDEQVVIHQRPRRGRDRDHERRDREPAGHTRRLAEEIAGAYSLGREIMGHKKNHVTHVVAEVLGAVAAMKNAGDHVEGME